MLDVIYLQLGAEGIPQLEIAARNLKRVEPTAKIILYSDQTESKLAHLLIDEYRHWPHPLSKQTSSTFGTADFGFVTLEKPRVILDALHKCSDWILFSDVDILALQPFSVQLRQCLEHNTFWVSCEGNDLYPRNHCTGLLAIKKHEDTLNLVNSWSQHHELLLKDDGTCHDQTAFNSLIQSNPNLETGIRVLPLGYAMAGWLFPMVYPLQLSRVTPTFFHCNWVKGHASKLKRLRQVEATLHYRHTWPKFTFTLLKQACFLWSNNRPSLKFWRR